MRRTTVSNILTAIATISLATINCLPAPAAESGSETQTISVPVYFLSTTGEHLPTASFPRDLVIQLGVIAGSLDGSPDAPLETFRVGPKGDIRLDLAALTAKLGKHATRFSERSGSLFELTPVGVQFARVSTGASTGAGALAGLAVVFWDPKANGSLVPLYCDRPCRLRAPKSEEAFDVDAPVPGLVWMLTTKDQNSRFVHVHARNPRPVIVIAPPEALERISPSTLAKREL